MKIVALGIFASPFLCGLYINGGAVLTLTLTVPRPNFQERPHGNDALGDAASNATVLNSG